MSTSNPPLLNSPPACVCNKLPRIIDKLLFLPRLKTANYILRTTESDVLRRICHSESTKLIFQALSASPQNMPGFPVFGVVNESDNSSKYSTIILLRLINYVKWGEKLQDTNRLSRSVERRYSHPLAKDSDDN
ncbi:hypothetical protein CEXT_250351 [Caerostris extrusa]|uniref:Uncharacterized protein n=1 Tax=Caerostris extrusa TaxID=172846 RepID=A0AAV4QPX7_CAEEX|nr:hypothetical protein CEXT_250351 [Caerostris extrusa]